VVRCTAFMSGLRSSFITTSMAGMASSCFFMLVVKPHAVSSVLGGDVSVLCGDVPVLCGDVLCGDVPVLCGDVPVLCGNVPVLCGDVPVLCGDVPVLCGDAKFCVSTISHTTLST